MGNSTPEHQARPARRKAAAASVVASTSLADALFTSTQQRVLALLYGQPERSYFISELINLTGSGSGAVQRELQRLTTSGLVNVSSTGRQKHYQANPACPIYHELVGIVRKTVAMVEPIRNALDSVADRIKLALIYGSVAKGMDTAESDIDLLVCADGLLLENLYIALAPAEARLDRKINPTLYTAQEFNSRRSAKYSFLSRILADEHLVLIEKEDGAY